MNINDNLHDYESEAFDGDLPSKAEKSVFRFSSGCSIAEEANWRRAEARICHDSDERLVPRFVSIGSLQGSPLEKYVHAVFGKVDIHPISTNDIRGLSTQLGDYSVIVILFDDVVRTKRVLRDLKPVLDLKLCYALMTDSTPQTRAALLRFAFADVFDTRMKPAELLLRMNSQAMRQAQYDLAAEEVHRFHDFCEENIAGRINALQIPVLRRLYDSLGKVVRYKDLAAYDFHSGEFRTESLTVRIHHLRRRLKNYEIRCEKGVGYALVKIVD